MAEVYEPLQRYLGRRVRPDDASEVLNDVLLVIWRRLDEAPPDAILPWSYGVAKHCLANQQRGDRRRLRLVGLMASHVGTSLDTTVGQSDHPVLATAIGELDESDRELVRLWAWEQLEPREIAVVLGTTANAISLKLTRAKKKLAASIERQNRAGAGHEPFGHGKEVGS